MGYSATLASSTGEFIIGNPEAALADLQVAQDCDRGGWTNDHLSWCQRVETYVGNPAERLCQLLADYGFDLYPRDDDTVEIDGWGGDKIGSDWNLFWDTLAPYVADQVTWIMVGEDGEPFAERIDGGVHTSPPARLTVD